MPEKMMRLAMVTRYPSTPGAIRGGVEGVAYNLCRELIMTGEIELHIVAPCGQRSSVTEERDGLTIHWLTESRLPGFISYWTWFRRAVHARLAKINPDLTHFQGIAGWTLGYTKPCVLTIHGINERDVLFSDRTLRTIRRKIVEWVERAGRMHCENVIVINPYVMDQLRAHIKGAAWPIENPVSDEFFEVVRGSIGNRILYVGVIHERKNVIGLIRAFKEVVGVFPDATLRMGGPILDEHYASDCRSLVNALNLGDSVVFLGPLDRKSVLAELSQARCLTLVSHQETAPLAVGEAMAAGVPIIASDICGLPYMIESGRTGFLVDQNDDEQIAGAICKVFGMREDYDEMSRRCREEARRRFQARAVAAKTIDIYRAVLGLTRPSGADTAQGVAYGSTRTMERASGRSQ